VFYETIHNARHAYLTISLAVKSKIGPNKLSATKLANLSMGTNVIFDAKFIA